MNRKNIETENLTEEEQILVNVELNKNIILEAKKNIENNIETIGMHLMLVKENLPKTIKFDAWLKDDVDFTLNTANRYIKSYKTKMYLGEKTKDEDIDQLKRIGNLSTYKLVEIGKLKKDKQLEFVAQNDTDSLSVRDIAEKIKEIKAKEKEEKETVAQNNVSKLCDVAQNKEVVQNEKNIDKIFEDTKKLNEKINILTDYPEEIENTMASRYQAGEITLDEFVKTCINNKLSIAVTYDKDEMEHYLNRFSDLYSSYYHYVDKYNEYYALFNKDNEWNNIFDDTVFTDKCNEDYYYQILHEKNYVIDQDLQVAFTYNENGDLLFILYKDYKIVAYKQKNEMMAKDIKKICNYCKMTDSEYERYKAITRTLRYQLKSYLHDYDMAYKEDVRKAEQARKDKEEYNKQKDFWTRFYQPYVMGKWTFEDIWDNKGRVKDFSAWREMTEFVNEQNKRQQSNYDWSNLFGNTKTIAIKEEDKEIYKKIYRTASLKLHPDVAKDNGRGMKILNSLKESWGI